MRLCAGSVGSRVDGAAAGSVVVGTEPAARPRVRLPADDGAALVRAHRGQGALRRARLQITQEASAIRG